MKEVIKSLIIGIAFTCMLVGMNGLANYIQHNYTMGAVVLEVNDFETVFVDDMGEMYAVTETDYTVGEEVKLYFHDNFTDSDRKDDYIRKVKRV